MKGILKNKDSKWIVEFLQKLTNVDTWVKELPLHPDDAKQLETGFTDKFICEVEFEIVEEVTGEYFGGLQPMNSIGNKGIQESNIEYAKLITPKKGSFDEDGFGITRVIDDKKEETTTSWNKICNLYYNFREENNISHNDVESFEYWLANNYHPPVKK